MGAHLKPSVFHRNAGCTSQSWHEIQGSRGLNRQLIWTSAAREAPAPRVSFNAVVASPDAAVAVMIGSGSVTTWGAFNTTKNRDEVGFWMHEIHPGHRTRSDLWYFRATNIRNCLDHLHVTSCDLKIESCQIFQRWVQDQCVIQKVYASYPLVN